MIKCCKYDFSVGSVGIEVDPEYGLIDLELGTPQNLPPKNAVNFDV